MKLGCNYWASNAGTEMWRHFEPKEIEKDLKILHENGVEYLRVFLNWRDFQPVEPLYTENARFREYRLQNGKLPENEFYLDEEMLCKFDIFCDICQKYGMKMIVGLLTGWMSGRLFIPPALYDKNLFTDPVCQYFEQLYVTGVVRRFKHKEAIYAWDHGNECNCLGEAGSWMAADSWTRMISNAVYAEDRTRPLISGQHMFRLTGDWRFAGQGAVCDMLVTHPYPFWGESTQNDTLDYIRTTFYAAATTKMHADLGGKPCLVEEIGTMGPSVCSEEFAADYLNVNFFSVYANGGTGLLWWCANDQSKLMTPPYTWTMCENELGMMDNDRNPKPVLKKMGELSKLYKSFDFTLPDAEVDAVCLLTRNQDEWGVGYMSYVLTKQAGLNISFADACKALPESQVYMLPSVSSPEFMPKEQYLNLCEKVKAGATLYISYDNAIIAGFEELTGNRIMDTACSAYSDSITLNGWEIPYTANSRLFIQNIESEQIQTPQITKHAYGKGLVYYVNFPVESMLIDKYRAFDHHVCEIYKEIFKDVIQSHEIVLDNKDVALTLHKKDDRLFAVAVNHSNECQRLQFKTELEQAAVHYGNVEACKPMDAVIVEYYI